MKLLFMTNLFPKEKEAEIRSKMKFNMNDAANALQWNIVNGLEECGVGDMTLYNHLPLDSFPENYPEWYVKGFPFSHDGKQEDKSIPFFNLKYVKQLFVHRPFVKESARWAKKNPEGVILSYTLSMIFLKAIRKAKKKSPGIRAYAVVADLPQFTMRTGNPLRRWFRKRTVQKTQKLLRHLDGFVLLTEQMAEKLAITQPYIVMEGIAPTLEREASVAVGPEKTVLYTGSMNKQFGILTLLDAFGQIKDPHYRLMLCGLGNAEEEIARRAKEDPRISFLGKVPHEEVLRMQQRATVLVNPRQNIEEFTKYSFPSKTMEYLASGAPVVAYHLDGIPAEYGEYLHYVPDNSPEALAAAIKEICEKPAEERLAMGEKGRSFVLNEKNNAKQSKKILDFMTK